MGFREENIVDFEDKTIEYQGINLYIVKQFEYEEKTYLYGVDVNTVNKGIPMSIVFLCKVDKDIFEHVESPELIEKLMVAVSGLCTAEVIENVEERFNKQ